MLCRNLVDHAQGSKFVDRLTSILGKLHKDLESYFDLDDRAKNIEELTDAFCCLELHSLVLLGQTRLNVLNECLGRSLVKCSVIEQRLFDEPDELTLCNRSLDLRLS